MSQTLLLTSAGMRIQDEILKLLPKPPAEIKLAHIITASNEVNPHPWRDNDKKAMLKLGIQVEDIDVKGKTENELRRILKNKNVIYVQGGSPYYLLRYVIESGFDKVAKDLIDKGAIYIGASAGSYITCPTIEQALWKKPNRNTYGLADNGPAMDLVPFLIVAHYEPKFAESVIAGINKTKYPVKVLTDDQAILVKDGIMKLMEIKHVRRK
ncbi:Type 1 glutamine amidotransferase-like domain-containing protein [Candidatus Collierbacteria bacterium]|nr:Type 1 glutamine amidotransferase-like domain-containing protein [Candidatus Collierbacteria bacterium]